MASWVKKCDTFSNEMEGHAALSGVYVIWLGPVQFRPQSPNWQARNEACLITQGNCKEQQE